MRFNIIVAFDKNKGIGVNNKIPWNFRQDMSYFKNVTKGAGDNAVIMGKNTYLSLKKPLPYRDNIVLSTTLTNKDVDEKVILCKNMKQLFDFITNKDENKVTPKSYHDRTIVTNSYHKRANSKIESKNITTEIGSTIFPNLHVNIPDNTITNYDDIWVIGGSEIYKQFLDMPEYINKVYVTLVEDEYNCDTFFPELPDYYVLEHSSVTSENNVLLRFIIYTNTYHDTRTYSMM